MPLIEAKTDEGVYFVTDADEESTTTTTTTTSISTDNSDEDYGYVPQALIDWMARDPNYVSQYPHLASCYPGGPSIKPDDLPDGVDGVCSIEAAAAQAASAVPDLTTSTQVTVSSAGCFHPGACPTPAPAAAPNAAVPADTALRVIPEEASVLASAPEQSQTQKAIVANSPTTVPNLGDMIVGALGGHPFAPSPDAPSPAPPAPKAPTPNVLTQNAPTLNTEGGQNPPPGVPATPAAGGPIITVGSQSITLDSASQFVVAGQTLTPGAPEISIQGTPVSLGLSASVIIVAGSTTTLPSPVSAPAITVGFQSITLNSASQYIVAGKTLTPGALPIDIQGTPVFLAPSTSAIVVAGSTIALPIPVSAPVVTIGDRPVTANSASQYVVDSKTLIPGGTAITVSGTVVSLAPSGTQIVIGSSTILLVTGQNLLPGGVLTAAPGSSPSPIAVGGQVFTPNRAAFAIAGTTLSVDGPGVTISGTLISLGPSGSLVIGTSTTVLSSEASPSIFTVGSQTFTANPTAFSVAGTTISAGGPGVTIAGTPVGLGQSGSLVIGTSITKLSPTAFTVGNQVFTPNPTAFPIAGTTISAGGPGVTIAGTPVSLGPSGSLVIGNSTIQLWPTSTGALGFTGQASRKSRGLGYEILGLIITCAVMLTSH